MGFACNRLHEREERERRRAAWILEEGPHLVTIVRWHFDPPGTKRGVVFELQNEVGQRQLVPFSLLTASLHTPRLSSFHAAAMGRTDPELHRPSLQLAKATTFRSLVGRRLIVSIAKCSDGLCRVLDWTAIKPGADRAPHDAGGGAA